MASAAQARVRELVQQKEAIETQLNEQYAVLQSHNFTGKDDLVDAEGFPRADVDVYAVRIARVRIIELRNDLAAIIDRIARALEGAFPPESPNDKADDAPSVELKAFAKVDGVAPGSPAADAGLQREDLFLKFGSLTASSFVGTSLTPLVQLVGAHENRSIQLKVLRGDKAVFLSLTPRQGWGGRGMLGCHILPYTAS